MTRANLRDITYSFRLNDKPRIYKFTVKTGLYQHAAAAIPAIYGIQEFPLRVTIWCERLVDAGYGPYEYVIERDECGSLVVHNFIRWLIYTINGTQYKAAWDAKLTFEDIAKIVYPNHKLEPGAYPSIVYSTVGRGYSLRPGCTVTLKDGMHITCCFTGNA